MKALKVLIGLILILFTFNPLEPISRETGPTGRLTISYRPVLANSWEGLTSYNKIILFMFP